MYAEDPELLVEAKPTRALRVGAEEPEHSKTETFLFTRRRRIPNLTPHLKRHAHRTAPRVKLGVREWRGQSQPARASSRIDFAGYCRPNGDPIETHPNNSKPTVAAAEED